MKVVNGLYTVVVLSILNAVVVFSAQGQKRNRGETFFNCTNSNTVGPGNLWLTLSIIGHIWDDSPITTDTFAQSSEMVSQKKLWNSNVRAFPEIKLVGGITEFLSVQAASRPLSYGFTPGFYRGGIKLTWPDNRELRLNGFGLSFDYNYVNRESAPSLGGYVGFMPEGFVVKGSTIEVKFLYELDIIKKNSYLPLRFLVNTGGRWPLSKRRELSQFLADIMVVYSKYSYDLYAGYSLESFMNFTAPIAIEQGGNKKFLVWFSENPMYLNIGGNIRYDNDVTISVIVPLLISQNGGSRMRREDMVELIHLAPNGIYSYEKERKIRDPFDPWFVKWKVGMSVIVPLKYTMTATEMMRNYLLLKNRKKENKIDIDKRLNSGVSE